MQYIRLVLWTTLAGLSWGVALYFMAKVLRWSSEKVNDSRDDDSK
jgi:hypothetical protein